MPKKYWLGISLVSVGILSAFSFSSTNTSDSLSNVVNSSGQKVNFPRQKTTTPAFSGVIFANGAANLIEPINKQQRQQTLAEAINSRTNANRDPFVALPTTVVAIPSELPEVPVPYVPPTPPAIVKPIIKLAPPTPKPLEAETITVTGALEIGGKNYAIVSVPGQSSSQYVTEGERLAENKVLVKSIELTDQPKVILQQNNAEVTHSLDKS